jgi:hypothetical protein
MPHADVTRSGDILTVEREEHGPGGWHNLCIPLRRATEDFDA